jgi:hypothetical protein
MHFARMQLDTLGYVAKLVPFSVCTSPTIMRVRGRLPSGAESVDLGMEGIKGIGNEELRECLDELDVFDDLYKVCS